MTASPRPPDYERQHEDNMAALNLKFPELGPDNMAIVYKLERMMVEPGASNLEYVPLLANKNTEETLRRFYAATEAQTPSAQPAHQCEPAPQPARISWMPRWLFGR